MSLSHLLLLFLCLSLSPPARAPPAALAHLFSAVCAATCVSHPTLLAAMRAAEPRATPTTAYAQQQLHAVLEQWQTFLEHSAATTTTINAVGGADGGD